MIEKVEIIKGAAGTLYGSEAMGGVVNIITKSLGRQNREFLSKEPWEIIIKTSA